MSTPTALLIGGTGPTGPHILEGLERRGYEVTMMHTGRHELPEVQHVPHIHCAVHDVDETRAGLGDRTFDVAIVTYGRLRMLAELLQGRIGKLISIGGVPAYRGYFDPDRFEPPGLPVPTREDAPTSTEDDDGKSYRIRRTEEMVFELHPTASHFRYPVVYGPRQLAPREWCVVRRVLDERPHIVVADGGLTMVTHGYTQNLAHVVTLPLDTDAGDGEIFNVGDDECLTVRQIVEVIAGAMGSSIEIVDMPWEFAVPARPLVMGAKTTHRVMSTDKLRTLLGYRDLVPARQAIAETARWLADHRPEPGGTEERVLEDPFDYDAEDRLVASWQAAMAGVAMPAFESMPGYGLSYAGPGTSHVRADTRI